MDERFVEPRPCYSICSELEGSEDLAFALGEGWEPFAVLPTIARNDWGEDYETVLIYLKRANR